MANYEIHEGGAAELRERLTSVTALYLDTRAEEPYNSAPLYHRGAFLQRTERQMARPGFRFVWTTDSPRSLVGFAFGLPSPIDLWWSDPLPDDIVGRDGFAVIELNVAIDHRGQGLARLMLDLLLTGREEPYAVLTATPNAPAREMYRHLGWRHVGTARFTDDGDWFDQLAWPLNTGAPASEQ